MDKYPHLDIFEDPRIAVETQTSRVTESITNILQLTGITVSGFVGITTMLLIMLSTAFMPIGVTNSPLVKGAAVERVQPILYNGNISQVEGSQLYLLGDESTFTVYPINFLSEESNPKVITDEFIGKGVSFVYNPEKNIRAYARSQSISTGDEGGPRTISMVFDQSVRKVGFFIQSGVNVDLNILRESKPVLLEVRDLSGKTLFNDMLTTCLSREKLCQPGFLGVESDGGIGELSLSTEYPFSFSIDRLYLEGN